MPKDNKITTPIVYMLVGIPGAGKSTYVRDVLPRIPFVSSDWYIEQWAINRGQTYNEIFTQVVKDAAKELNKDVEFVTKSGMDFIWDQTNLNVKTRAGKLSKIPDIYKKIAIVFNVPLEVAIERNSNRDRTIPEHIIKSMHDSFEMPTIEEGFDEVIHVDYLEEVF